MLITDQPAEDALGAIRAPRTRGINREAMSSGGVGHAVESEFVVGGQPPPPPSPARPSTARSAPKPGRPPNSPLLSGPRMNSAACDRAYISWTRADERIQTVTLPSA